MSNSEAAVGATPSRQLLPRAIRRRLRHGTPYLFRALVLSETLVDHLAKQVVIGPSQVLDLDHKLRPNPMHAAQHQR
jgi:hypothetical protein